MRGNVVHLESLGVGRCFTLPLEPAPPEPDRPAGTLRHAQPVLAPAQAWKVTGEAPDGLLCESARGERRSFPGDARVVEIPRQGWEKLASAAAHERRE